MRFRLIQRDHFCGLLVFMFRPCTEVSFWAGTGHPKHVTAGLVFLSVSPLGAWERKPVQQLFLWPSACERNSFRQCLFADWTGNETFFLCLFKNIFVYLGERTRTGFSAYRWGHSKWKGWDHDLYGLLFLAGALTETRTGHQVLLIVDSGGCGWEPRGFRSQGESWQLLVSSRLSFCGRTFYILCVLDWDRGGVALASKGVWRERVDQVWGSGLPTAFLLPQGWSGSPWNVEQLLSFWEL